MVLSLTSPPMSQKNVRELTTPSLNHYYETPHHTLQVGTHSFVGFLVFFKKIIYLFIWLRWVLVVACGIFVVACGI